MSKPRSRQSSRARRRSTRQRTAIIIGVAAVAVVALTGAVLAVRATGRDAADRIHLYQGETTLGGANVNLSALVGKGEPVVVNFWASNCPPCRMEMPGFQHVYAEHGGKGYLMLGVDVGPQTGLGTHEGARALLQQEDIAYPVGYAEGNGLVVAYGLRGMPTTLFFDASGHQVGRVVGYLPEPQLRTRLASLLATN